MGKLNCIIALIFLGLMPFEGNAQSNDCVYIICSSVELPKDQNIEKGIRRFNTSKDLYRTPAVNILLTDRSKGIECWFSYYDYDLSKLARIRPVRSWDRYEISTEPISFLETISPIDLNAKLPTLTKASAEAWIDELRDKKVYMIDRSEIGPDSVIVRQVRCSYPRGW